jgi:hypothetical protein
MLVQDLIIGALQLLGIPSATETPADEDLTLGLNALNELINNWNTQYRAIFTIVQRQLALVGGTSEYTMGVGGDFDLPRPVKVQSAGVIQPNTLRIPMDLITSPQWAAIEEKTAQARLPQVLYNNNDYPLTHLFVWPVPIANCILDVWVWDELTDALLLTDAFDVPPGYLRPVRFNLAMAIAAAYGITPLPTLVQIATESKDELFRLNLSNFANTQDAPPPPG